MARVVNGESYEMFVETVLPVLLESSEFPALKTIRTFGFEAYDEKRKHTSNPMRLHDKYTENSVDVPGQLQAAFPNVMVTDHVGRRILMDSEDDGTPSGGGELIQIPYDMEHMKHPQQTPVNLGFFVVQLSDIRYSFENRTDRLNFRRV